MSAANATVPERLFGWLDERFGVQKLVDWAKHKEVPVGGHSMVWYYLGGTTLFFFTMQIVSGVAAADVLPSGRDDLVRVDSLHHDQGAVRLAGALDSLLGRHLMTLSLVVHMFSTMFLKAYRKPRELTWVTGFACSGWCSASASPATCCRGTSSPSSPLRSGTDSVKACRSWESGCCEVMRGGPDVTINTLYRFFALHVVHPPAGDRGHHRRAPRLHSGTGHGPPQ